MGWYARRTIHQQETLLMAQAKKRHGQVKLGRALGLKTSPTLLLAYKDYDLTVSFTLGRNNISSSTCVTASIPVPPHIQCVVSNGWFEFGDTLGMHRYPTKNRPFDNIFNSHSTDEPFLRAFLTLPVQNLLLRLSSQFGACRLDITSEAMAITIGGIPHSEQTYDDLLDITLRCLEWLHTVTRIKTIVFGQRAADAAVSHHTLVNPDDSTLTCPPLAVTSIVIDADSYNPRQVERFLTYAINHIGHVYLKHVVDVVVCGNMACVHPNLRNNLVNLCHSVSVHGRDAGTESLDAEVEGK